MHIARERRVRRPGDGGAGSPRPSFPVAAFKAGGVAITKSRSLRVVRLESSAYRYIVDVSVSDLMRGDGGGWSVRNGSALGGSLVEVRQPVRGRASKDQGRLVRDDDGPTCADIAAFRGLGILRRSAALRRTVVRWRSGLARVESPSRRRAGGDPGRAG